MCDSCTEILDLLATCDPQVNWGPKHRLGKISIQVICRYVQGWGQRQCMCLYKESRNYDRFNYVIQGVLWSALELIRSMTKEEAGRDEVDKESNATTSGAAAAVDEEAAKNESKAGWTLEEKEQLFQFVTKVFVLNFPHYTAYKHSVHSKLEEISQQEATILSVHCDINDPEIPIHLLRNVCFFCDYDALVAMTACFMEATPDSLPFFLARAMISIVSNLKLWMNVAAVVKFLVPLRTAVIRYMCQLSDKDLRAAGTRSMSEFMWTAVKDPLDSHLAFDKEGLDLAYKYFTSSTLTMRLAGIAHINNHITMYNELTNSETMVETEDLGLGLADWLIQNRIVENIFGPNLHVEIIKQSHVVLNFLAMEGCITEAHVDCMWSAAQLKHCSKQVHDLLLPLIKHLEPLPVVHLYNVLCKMETREHTEQTLYLASALLKVLWSSGHQQSSHLLPNVDIEPTPVPFGAVLKGAIGLRARDSSSEHSISLDSEEEQKTAAKRVGPSLARNRPVVARQERILPASNWPDDPTLFTSSDEESDDDDDSQEQDPSGGMSKEGGKRSSSGESDASVDSGGEKEGERIQTSSSSSDARTRRPPIAVARPRRTMHYLRQHRQRQRRMRLADPDEDSVVSSAAAAVELKPSEGQETMAPQDNTTTAAAGDQDLVGNVDNVYECIQLFKQNVHPQRLQHHDASELVEDVTSADDGTCSSRMSTKSEKNMADFEGEESGCEDELIQLTGGGQAPHHPHSSRQVRQQLAKVATSVFCSHQRKTTRGDARSNTSSFRFDIENVCRPGHTVLWDLLQDANVVSLGKGLALEAEKVLSNLVCWSTDRSIRMKFIEGCLHILAQNESIYLALRLLPRLFGSFQQYRGRMDTHSVTMWAEKEHSMMSLFFNNLLAYTEHVKTKKSSGQATSSSGAPVDTLYGHLVEIQVRLQFLTCIFSAGGSPDFFRLSAEQVDCLWSCLASDQETADELFSWLLTQVKSKDQHALGLDALKHIFNEKLPLIEPETTSMTALNLIQQLGSLLSKQISEDSAGQEQHGMDQLWGIALRARSTDVSMAAIQYLNNYYINGHLKTLEREEEFIQRCMTSLALVLPNLNSGEDSSLMVVQRALILLKTHLEAFQRRYAYHLRMWQLEGRGIYSHQRPLADRQVPPIRIVCQPAGVTEKVILELQPNDYVADLRAEVTHWWDQFQHHHHQTTGSETAHISHLPIASSSSASSVASPILGAMLTDGPIRVITQGQELTTDLDERYLSELGFKDMQLVFVSVGAPRPHRKRDDSEPASSLPPPPRNKLPAILLLQQPYLEQLFELIQHLGELKQQHVSSFISHSKGHLLSWRVWEILMMLPTCPSVLTRLHNLEEEEDALSVFKVLLAPEFPHKLMYSLQIVESLAHSERSWSVPGSASSSSLPSRSAESRWASVFVKKGGLEHLFHIFMSGVLQEHQHGVWSEWNQDCLAYLLKLIYQLGVEMPAEPCPPPLPLPQLSDSLAALTSMTSSSSSSPSTSASIPQSVSPRSSRKSKKQQKQKCGSAGKCHSERLVLPRLNQVMIDMIADDDKAVAKRLVSILYDAGKPRDEADHGHYKIGVGGRGQVVHFAMSFMSAMSSCEHLKTVLFRDDPYMTGWLRPLLLDDPEPSVRQEVCSSLYRLCLGCTSDGHTGQRFVVPLLHCLIDFLSYAKNMKPRRIDHCCTADSGDKDKEPYGPACREYFWLVCRLFDSYLENKTEISPNELAEQIRLSSTSGSKEPTSSIPIDVDGMAHQLAESILSREILETTRHDIYEDDGLIGLLNLCTAVFKHDPPFKFQKEGREFLSRMLDCVFALPSPGRRHLPLCKSQQSRSAAYDLLVELTKGCLDNYIILHAKLLQQHSPGSHSPYPWDYWPHEDGRSDCGYVGLTNLGATCYMAACMQHLYMMPQARASILSAKQCSLDSKHESTLKELQRMFAYLLESERKAYNPRSFCKVYTMDHQPLNTGEQKDMAEFFTDLISKLEEMTPQLKELVKTLFCGVITNNVVSLDCPHVSRTIEEFYTVRCQVADMRNLYESLDEVTVKDTLEGDNMYTCSQCGKKVRAEKRACFKKLPRILCFNTMRYTFNMVTMMKEKVNTHFSFPLCLDMSKYTERHLMRDQCESGGKDSASDEQDRDEYDLIGITVHTGTADGGHYYSFIRDRTASNRDKWFLFNDAEVKPFDPAQIAAECFGGEMTSKTYDSVTDKFMDFSFEKTNSAYMLFYERSSMPRTACSTGSSSPITDESKAVSVSRHQTVELPKDLADWIWEDNMQFLQDKNILEHTYFNFMWQICGYVPQSLTQHKDVTLLAAKLSTSFVLETLIHAKEKPTMVQWIELLTKLFNSSQSACEWFLDHMAEHDWWPVQILIRCPNQVVRQMFQRLCIHVINKLRPPGGGDESTSPVNCIERFVKKLLSLMDHGASQHAKHLTEYFGFLLDYAKMSLRESRFLLSIDCISTVVNFYLGHKAAGEYVDSASLSDEDDDEADDVLSLSDDKYKPASLEKMVTLVATLVEKSRSDDHHLHLSPTDLNAVAGGKGFPFLYQQIRDNINVRQTCNLIFSLSRWNEAIALHIVTMIFQSISQHPEQSQPFFKLLSLLVEFVGGPPGMPAFTRIILQHIWEVAEACPQQCLEWLSVQVPRNKMAHSWVLQNMESWVEHFLISHTNQRVRNAAAFLLVCLIPSSHFKQAFRNARAMVSPQKEIPMSPEAIMVLHHIYDLLLRLLKRAKHYVDVTAHGTMKLMSYFALMTYCLVSHTEKLMFGQYFMDLWQLFQPKLSEPPIAVHHNKQAMLIFWYQVCLDCPENVKLIVQNAHVTKNIAFNYILADHEDQEVMIFNRFMLPAYYGLLRLCCQQSRPFTRQLANHQNIQWAFKNITPYPAHYPMAVEELYKLMRLFVAKYPDSSEQELKEIAAFKCTTLQLYLSVLDGRACWATLVSVIGILVDCDEDRFFLIAHNGMPMLFEAFQTLHVMYHEATACHVTGDLVELLSSILKVLKCARLCRDGKGVKQWLYACKDRVETIRKLLTLLNSYAPGNLRQICIDVLRELLLLYPIESLQTMVPIMTHSHSSCQENAVPVPMGPYFPRRGQKPVGPKTASRPPNPFLQMTLHPNQLEAAKGADPEYDQALLDYYLPYHMLLDIMCRVAVNNDAVSEALVNLSAAVGTEGIPLHLVHFPKLWIDVYQAENVDRKYVDMLCSSFFFLDYVDRMLSSERSSLTNPVIFQFLCLYMPKVAAHWANDRTRVCVASIMSSLETAMTSSAVSIESHAIRINGDLLACKLLLLVECPHLHGSTLLLHLEKLVQKCMEIRQSSDSISKESFSAGLHLPSPTGDTNTTCSVNRARCIDHEEQDNENEDGSGPVKRLKTENASPPSRASSSSVSASTTLDGSDQNCWSSSQQVPPHSPSLSDWLDVLAKTAASLASVVRK